MQSKAVGGGACGIFAPAVGSSVGTNNTGMLARIWGKTTTELLFANGRYYYNLDDGSGVASEGSSIGVRVYEAVGYPVGTNLAVTGIVGCEIPDGATASIPTLTPTTYYPPASGTGMGTVSGTVTANANASGKTVRIYGTGGLTTCVLNSSGIGTYTMSTRAGDHTLAADLAGYAHSAKKLTVVANQTTTCNFTLAPIGKSVSVFANPTRIAPDGTSTSIVTAIVADEEGRRLANQPVSWNIDLGTVISSDATTDAAGVATLILQAPSTPGTANVSITVGGSTTICYVEFASPTAPSVRILTHREGERQGLRNGVGSRND
jgi:adhesin/invasin